MSSDDVFGDAAGDPPQYPGSDGGGYVPPAQPQSSSSSSGLYPSIPSFDVGGCANSVCDCIGDAVNSIAQSQYRIANLLDQRLGKLCDNIDQCIDQIAEKLKAKWEKGQKTCDECKSMALSGAAGTIEYAIACANSCQAEAKKSCSPGSGAVDGDICTGCGESPCCCKQGSCVPCPEEEKPKKGFQGWCNPINGLVVVTAEGAGPPSPEYIPGPLETTEQVAYEAAVRYCSQRNQQINPPVNVPPLTADSASQICNINDYVSGQAAANLGAGVGLANRLGGAAQFLNAIGGVGFAGISVDSVGGILEGISRGLLSTPMGMVQDFSNLLGKMTGCTNETYVNMIKSLSSFAAIQQRMGADFSELLTPFWYALRQSCPFKLLSPDQATAAFMANQITKAQLKTYWSIQGYCPSEVDRNLLASRSKPIPAQLSMMRLRGLITYDEYQSGMRQLGYLETSVTEQLHSLYQQLPPMSEIIRYMVRDAADEGLVAQFGLDDLFAAKYTGQLKKWGEQQGIPEELAKFSWRAHWIIPAPGQLFEMYHRLRKDPQYGGETAFLKIIKDALAQQDIAPYWQDKFIAISFRPMGRVDIRRAFNIGAIQEKELPDLYAQLGYSDDVAAKQTKFSVKLRDISALSHKAIKLWLSMAITRNEASTRMVNDGLPQTVVDQALADSEIHFESSPMAQAFVKGVIDKGQLVGILSSFGVSNNGQGIVTRKLRYKRTKHPAIKKYELGLMTGSQARDLMTGDGMDTDIVDTILSDIADIQDEKSLQRCINGIRRRYVTGDLDQSQADNELQQRGISPQRSGQFVSYWNCEKSSYGKAIPATTLCKWLSLGGIQPQDFVKRLINIGYSPANANLMLSDCLTNINDKRLKLAQKEAKDQELAARRAATQANKLAAAAQRSVVQLAKARKKQAQIRQGRDTQLLKSAENVMIKSESTLTVSMQTARDLLSELQTQYGLPVDEALQIMLVASEKWQGGELADYVSSVAELANAAASSDFTPPLEEVLV